MRFKEQSEYTDEQLMELIRMGNENAFSALYNRYWNKLYTVAHHRLSDDIEAEEVVQELFVSIWSRREQLEIKTSVAAYFSVSIKYQIINKFATRKRQVSFKENFIRTIKLSEETTDQWISEKELKAKLESHINQLPEKCRIVFRMSREEGKNAREISEELSLAEKTIEAHITKALKILRSNFPSIVIGLISLLLKK